MRILLPFLSLFVLLTSCSSQSETPTDQEEKDTSITPQISAVETYYADHFQDSVSTKSIGSVSNGKLENGTIIPFSGSNFAYFDTSSYLAGRAFTHQDVAKTIIGTFQYMEEQIDVKRTFKIMEFSNEHGGKMYPHRTHQNGLSVDLMMPLKKNEQPYYGLDDLGAMHYLLDFNKKGQYIKDTTISIDFEMVATEIMTLDRIARENGLKVSKVIFNTDLRDELFATTWGQIMMSNGPYVTRNLEKVINDLHDDHFHVDFQPL